MRNALSTLLLIGALLPTSTMAQVVPTRTDLELVGRVIGPLPVQPGRASRFLLTARNLGPNPLGFVYISSLWPYDASNLDIAPQNGPRCYAFRDVSPDPPTSYGLVVGINVPLAPGESAACEFELTVTGPLAPNATITFEAYADANFNQLDDPNFSNNRVTFGLGQAPVVSIPTLGAAGVALLCFMFAAIGAARRRRNRHVGPRAL